MATAPKTQITIASVNAFIATIADENRRKDCQSLVKLMQAITGTPPKMWGAAIVGFGSYRYRYESGHEGDWPLVGFSSRKANLTLYVMAGFAEYGDLLKQLGKFKTGKSCLYMKSLSDVDPVILHKLIAASVAFMRKKYGSS